VRRSRIVAADVDSGLGPADLSGMAELTIYIVEDSVAVRERLVESLADVPNSRVVGYADAVAAAFEGVLAERPRVLILDVQLRGGSGFHLLKRLRASGVEPPESVIIVTNYPTDDYRTAGRECGADHFFGKASEFHKVREVLMQLGT
jgi:DNA-binding response OmpR family regulator